MRLREFKTEKVRENPFVRRLKKLSEEDLLALRDRCNFYINQIEVRRLHLEYLRERVFKKGSEPTRYQTTLEFVQGEGYTPSVDLAVELDKRCRESAQEVGIPIGCVPDEECDLIRSYPICLLTETLEQIINGGK